MLQLGAGALVERDDELSAIAAALDRAASDGAVLAVEGPPGIGKTALLEAARTEALDRGFRLLTARAGEHEREFSWGIARQLFEPVLAAATEAELEQLWKGPAASARPLFEATGLGPERDNSFALSRGLFWLAANIALEQPALLVVDDLHWCDGSSLSFLDYFARRLDGQPLGLLGTLRPREPGAEHALLDSICAGPSAAVVRPGPLSEAGASALLAARLERQPEPKVASASHRITRGNPLLLSELASTLRSQGVRDDAQELLESGGRAVQRTVAIRMRGAGPAARRLVQAAAVLGEDAPLATAVELAELEAAKADEAARQLAAIDVLRPGTAVHFAHPVVRAAIYEEIGPLERSRLHARAAALLRESGAPLERVASHLLHVAPAGDVEVFAALRDASRSALASGDMGAAVALLRRALDEPPPPEERVGVLTALGLAAALRDAPAAIGYLTEALEGTADVSRRAAVAELLIRALQFVEQVEQAAAVGTRILGELGPEHERERRRLEATLIELDVINPSGSEWIEEAIMGAASVEPDDYAACMLISVSLGARMRALQIGADEAASEAERALTGGKLMHEGYGGIAQVIPATTLAVAGRPAEGIAVCDEALTIAEDAGSVLGYVGNLLFRAFCHQQAGNVDGFLADAEETYRSAIAYGTPPGLTWSSALWAEGLMERGDLEEAERRLLQVGPLEQVPDRWHWFTTKLAWSRLWLLRGEPERALELARAVGAAYEELGGLNPVYVPWRFRAGEAYVLLPERAEEPSSRRRPWSSRGAGAPRRGSGSPCGCRRSSSPSGPRSCLASPWPPSRARRRAWSARARWSSWARPCAAPTAAATRVSRCARASIWPSPAAPPPSSTGPGRSCAPPACGCAAPRSAARGR